MKMKLKSLFGLLSASKGVKWCKSEGLKCKLSPTLTNFWVSRGVKRCKSSGVISPLSLNSYIILPPLKDQNGVRVWVNLSFTPSLLHHFASVGSPMHPKKM